jgi:hypothetical protein
VWQSPERGGYAFWKAASGWGGGPLLVGLGSEVGLGQVRLVWVGSSQFRLDEIM